jgi:hypothetical protein
MTLPLLLQRVQDAGHAVFDSGPFDLNIIGQRSTDMESNRFNDALSVVFRDVAGDWQQRAWAITTDPGQYWRDNPGRRAGVALLQAGQMRGAFGFGKHKGKYPCLVQTKAVTVWRPGPSLQILPDTPTQTGFFGIQIHKAGRGSRQVDRWSAGCQVFANAADFDDAECTVRDDTFMGLCRHQYALHPTWNFTYTLLV